jgi:hypothetical protein
MTLVAFLFGILLVGAGFVRLVWKLHDRSMHESLALLTAARGNAGQAVAALVSLIVPVVSSIAAGLAFVTVGLLSR